MSVLSTLLAGVALLALLLVAAPSALGQEITNSGDNLRTGWYPDEPSLTPQLVSGGTFGQLWSASVEGQVYAQPLLDDGTLFVATEKNKVYGLDPTTGALQWSQPLNLGTPWNPSDIGCGDLTPSIGVTATPVIDPTTHIAYLTHKTYASGSSGPARWYMDAVNVTTGSEEPGFPVELSGTAQNAPAQTFQPTTQLQRPGLLLMNGVVYAAFGSHCDITPWQGWVFGVSTAGAITARWVSVASGSGAGIWQSGAGLTSDAPGNILLSTGNGGAPETPAPGNAPPANLGESVIRLQVQPDGSLKPTDFFAPFDAESLDSWDADFASGGVTGLPAEFFGTAATPHLAVAVGKDGYVYLLNRDDLGGIGQGPSGADDVVQRIGPYGGVWSRPGVWPGEGGWVYIPTASGGTTGAPSSGNLRVYQYGLSGTGTPTLSLQATSSDAFGFSSSAPVITSDGTTPSSALIWLVWAPNGGGTGAQLRAYEPIPKEGKPVLLFSAPIGTSAKFALPGVGAGRLYVGTRDGHVLAFGSPVTPVLSGPATAFPTTTLGESSEKTLTLTANEALTLASLESSSSQFTLGTPSIPLPAALAPGQTIQIPITFAPTATGPLAATLTAKTSSGKTATFALSGNAQAASAKLEVTPPLVTFGGTTIGGQLSAGATFRNVGGTPLSIEAVHLPAAPFAAEGVPALGSTIEPGHALTITVTFDPTATGKFESQIGLDTTGGNGAVGLSGSAGLPGALQIASETNDYGEVPVGASASKSFTITNSGGTNVTITKSKPPIGGAFTATTSLPEGTTIEPGEVVTETVTFAPSSSGATSSVWEINGEDTTGLHEVHFDGVGALPAPAPGPSEETPPVIQPPQPAPTLALVQQGPAIPALPPQTHEAPLLPDAELTSAALAASASGTVRVRVSCPARESRCFGRVALRMLTAIGATGGHSKSGKAALLTLAAGSFTVAGGHVSTVRLHLSQRARALLARRHLIRARVTLVAHDLKGLTHTTVRSTITIRAV
ncbi:MAG TPA: choice-of-anchor D domain-containing protein [Solirubrobacteraceae bacterium]